jgi:hypothetical protein
MTASRVRDLAVGISSLWVMALFVCADPLSAARGERRHAAVLQASTTAVARGHTPDLFATSDSCMACHNGLRDAAGEDVSIGAEWRTSMMANSGRDPYWIASVRREIADHPAVDAEIQDGCSVCHLPMARTTHIALGQTGKIFAHMPPRFAAAGLDRLAHDGVSCTVCHQITPQKLGTPGSFNGGYVIDTHARESRPVYGPFDVDPGRTAVMRSASGFAQERATHLEQSELCATCHTVITTALGPDGQAAGRLPEQVPYQEWKHSEYVDTRSCQSCHMPTAGQDTPVSSVLGQPRRLARHLFLGGNFFMLRMLNRYRDDLAVPAPSTEMDRAVIRTITHLQKEAAVVAIEHPQLSGNTLSVDVTAQNLSGHKLPTGYPSRRVWLHVTVRDRAGRAVFESGAVGPTGQIAGNDNDHDGRAYEPHYSQITSSDQVQIYESVMGDVDGTPTTGLLQGVRFLKDNRLLPRGFDKATADQDTAVAGAAMDDATFGGGGDRVHYVVNLGRAEGPFQIDAELRFQPIGFRWAENLRRYDSSEVRQFVRYYESLASVSSEVLSRATALVSSSSH